MHQSLYPLHVIKLRPMRRTIRLPPFTRFPVHSIVPRPPTRSPALVLLLDKPLPLLLSPHPISTATPSHIHSIRIGMAREAAHIHSNRTSTLPPCTSLHSIIITDPIDLTTSHHERCFSRSSSYSSILYTPSRPVYTDHPLWPISAVAEKSKTRSSSLWS